MFDLKHLIGQLLTLPRLRKKLFLVGVDFLLLCGTLWLAFFIRLQEAWPEELAMSWPILLIAAFMALPAFITMGLYNAVIRYITPRFIITILKAVSVATAALFVLVTLSGVEGFPRSVFVLYWFLSLILIGGSRMLAREIVALPMEGDRGQTLVAIYGAGAAGTQVFKALRASVEFRPVAFLDNSPELQGMEMLGCKVHAPEDLAHLIGRYRLKEVILCVPSATRARQREIIAFLQPFPVVVKTLPGIPEMVAGEFAIDNLRRVDIEDLLGRDPVEPNQTLLRACISHKNVLVTGAGGSIGSELCHQIADLGPASLVLYEISEYALYQIEMSLQKSHPHLHLIPLLGSINDGKRLGQTLSSYQIHTVYHAAAYKHVPLVECNLIEGVKNNVLGSWTVCQAAMEHQVENCILISSDKAVRPHNIMGATKRLAEWVFLSIASSGKPNRNPPCFTLVRFGNVLGSSGSVVPLFREQIRKGGPLTVTHPDMTRYFMTLREAAQLVIQAGSMGSGNDIFVLDMGEAVRIQDLARNMIRLSGLTLKEASSSKGDIAIEYTGLRPGEKLFEELLIGHEALPTRHPRIQKADEPIPSWPQVNHLLNALQAAVEAGDSQKVLQLLEEADIGYKPQPDRRDLADVRNPHENKVTRIRAIR